MEPVTLTGRAASEALALYTRIGAADARFDRRKLALALRTSAGRRRVAAGLVLALRAVAAAVAGVPAPPRGGGRENGSRRLRRASTDTGSPDRPRPVDDEDPLLAALIRAFKEPVTDHRPVDRLWNPRRPD